MKTFIAATALVALVGPLGCEPAADLSPLETESGATGASVAAPSSGNDAPAVGAPSVVASPSFDQASSCERGALPAGAEVWRQGVSEDDVLKFTTVASDPTTGAVFVARTAGEIFKIDRAGSVVWQKPFGSLVATDGRGNAYAAGTFSGTVELGPHTLASAGGTDVYVARLDPDGGISYAVGLGGTADETAIGIAVDVDGNAIISGPGLGTVKLGAAGGTLWQKEFFGHVAVDSVGNVLLTGALAGTMTFGAVTLESDGGDDVFVAKLDADGNTLFALEFGDAGIAQRGEAIAAGPADDILVSGVIDGSVDFGGGALGVPSGTCPAESWCKQAGFVVAFDPAGGHLWSHARAPVRSLPGIAVDSRGNVLVSGALPGNAPPYRIPLLLAFDSTGSEIPPPPSLDAGLLGAGHGVAFDHCDDVLWALSIPPSPGVSERSFLVKLAP